MGYVRPCLYPLIILLGVLSRHLWTFPGPCNLSMAHYDIFRDQFGIKYPAFGHALWEPNIGNDVTTRSLGCHDIHCLPMKCVIMSLLYRNQP